MWLAELLFGLIHAVAEHVAPDLVIHAAVEHACEPEAQFERVLAGEPRHLNLNDH
jgi:hypothetical protein